MTPDQRKQNIKLGLTLASVAICFFVGFVAKMIWLGH